MFTKIAASFVAVGIILAGMMSANDQDSNNLPSKSSCCQKKAYCCQVKNRCCFKLATTEDVAVAKEAAVDDDIVRPICCLKHAYCCSIKARCCRGSSISDKGDETVSASKSACCVKRAYCCKIVRSCCSNASSMDDNS